MVTGIVEPTLALIEKTGLPFAELNQDRGVLSMQHPNYIGSYNGHWAGWSDSAVTDWVEQCDCIVALATENHDFNNGFHTLDFDRNGLIKINPHSTLVGDQLFENVEMADVLAQLTEAIQDKLAGDRPKLDSEKVAIGLPTGKPEDIIDYEPLYERLQQFINKEDIVVSDTAMASMCFSARVELPDGVDLEAQLSWGAIGWGTPAILGNCIAAPQRRCVIVCGEGGHQMTATEMGTFERYGAKPIYIVVNNGGYLAERVTNRYPDEDYNNIAHWNFTDLPSSLGCNWLTRKVTNLGELDKALTEASECDSGAYIEVVVPADQLAKGCDFLFGATGKHFEQSERTWDTRISTKNRV